MEENIVYFLIGGGVVAGVLLVIFWPSKEKRPEAPAGQQPHPPTAQQPYGSPSTRSSVMMTFEEAFTAPPDTQSVETMEQMEQSAADLEPKSISSSSAEAMVAKDTITKRLTIKLRPTLLPGSRQQQQQAFVDVQKHWIREVCHEMHGRLAVRETEHFLLVSDADKSFRDYLKLDMELRYRELIGFFSLPLNPELWDGKLSIFLFLNNDDYKEFATRLDGFTPRVTETGYIRIQERLAHIVLRRPFDEIGATLAFVQHLCGVICHYLAGGDNMPRWMLEGLVIYLQTQTQVGKSYRDGWYRTAIRATTFHGSGVNMLLTGTCFLNPNAKLINDGLACSFALVELLITTNHKLFLKTLEGLKRGGEAEDLIRRLYGEKLTHIWRVWESENLATGEKRQMDDTVRKALEQLRSLANPDFIVPSSSHQMELVKELTESRADLSTADLKPAVSRDEEDTIGGKDAGNRIQESQAILRRLGIKKDRK